MNAGMDPQPFARVRAEVALWCGICEDTTDLGTFKGKNVWERVQCGTCREWYLLKVEADAEGERG